MDLISQLPEPILHDILRRLPSREVVRTCVLSKAWRLIEARTPFLRFNEVDFCCRGLPYDKETMFSYVDKRLVHNKLAPFLEEFKLRLHTYDPDPECHDSVRVDTWLKHVIKGIQVLVLDFDVKGYILPPFVFHCETLTVLRLYRCELDACGQIWLPKLEKLCIYFLDVDQDIVEWLIHGCPLLKHVTICACNKLTSVQVTSLAAKLQFFAVNSCQNLRNVEIQSPNLQYFEYAQLDQPCCDLNLALLGTIKQLFLESAKIQSSCLQQQVSRCQELYLSKIDGFEGTNISSQMLRKLTIAHCTNMKEVVQINCPNLQSLVYIGNRLPFHSMSNLIFLHDIRIDISIYSLHTVWYNQLKDFFKKLGSNKEFIKQVVIYAGAKDLFILDGLMVFMITELYDIEDLLPTRIVFLSSISNSLRLNYICNWVKGLYRTTKVVHCNNNNFSEFLFEKLSRIGAEANCCQDTKYKCWRHYLCTVKKDLISNIIPAALRSQQFDQYQITSIILEWTNQAYLDSKRQLLQG